MKFINPNCKKVELTEEEKKTIEDCIEIIGEISHEMAMNDYENLLIKDDDNFSIPIQKLILAEDTLMSLQNVIEIF